MRLFSKDFAHEQRLPLVCAFGTFESKRFHMRENLNPHLAWTDAPSGTASFALICDDIDCPDVDQAAWSGGPFPKSFGMRVFCHWLLVDIPSTMTEIARGEFSDGAYVRGKPGPHAKHGTRQGSNDYTDFFAANGGLFKGTYYGYDGPWPPEGAKPHRYVFDLYSLSVPVLDSLQGTFEKKDVLAAIEGKVLAKASLTGMF